MQWIKRAWCGEEKLWKVFYYSLGFWIVFILISTLSIAGIGLIAKGFSGNPSQAVLPLTPTSGWVTPTTAWWILFLGLLVEIVVTIPITVWQTVAVWRCAFNARAKLWGYLARAFMILCCIQLAFTFIGTLAGLPALMGSKPALYELACQYNMAAYYKSKFPHDGTKEMQQYVDQHPNDLKDCIQVFYDSEPKP